MAEDTVRSTPRFFCHLCSGEVQGVNADFTCSVCSSGFIEEIPLGNGSNNRGPTSGRRNDIGLIRDEIASLLLSRTGLELINNANDNTGSNRRVANIARIQNFDRLDNILLEILNSLAVVGTEQSGNTVFIGNPGDYAWGREGVDTIVTQLLNQMDTTGPPPLDKDEINNIPTVEITECEVQQKLQCSVCWDNFKLEEKVRKLPCSHLYHDNCIVPWLRIHGTCPICRKLLSTSTNSNNSTVRLNATNLDTNSIVRQAFGFDSSLFNAGNPISMQVNLPSLSNTANNSAGTSANVSRSNTNSTTSNSSRTNQQDPAANSSSSSNLTSQAFKFDDGNIEYDFD